VDYTIIFGINLEGVWLLGQFVKAYWKKWAQKWHKNNCLLFFLLAYQEMSWILIV